LYLKKYNALVTGNYSKVFVCILEAKG